MNTLQGIFSYCCNKLHLKNHQHNRLENTHLFSCSGMFSQLHYAVLRCVMAQISNWVWIFSSGLYNLLEAAPTWRCSSIALPGTKKRWAMSFLPIKAISHISHNPTSPTFYWWKSITGTNPKSVGKVCPETLCLLKPTMGSQYWGKEELRTMISSTHK